MGGFLDALTGKSAKRASEDAAKAREENRVAVARNEQNAQNQEADTRMTAIATKKAPRGRRLLLGDASSTLG